jgi:hypothetical protein
MRLRIGYRRLQIGVATVALALVAGRTSAADELIDRVLAVVAGKVVMLTDVTAALDLGLIAPEGAPDPVRFALTALIDRELILAEVDRYAPQEPAAEAVDREVAAVQTRFPSRQALDGALAQSGLDQKQLRAILRDDLRLRAYLDQRFIVPPPSDDELSGYYRANPQAFSRDGQVVPFDAARPEVARRWTTERRQRLIDDWVAGLRRRAEIADLYLAIR